VKAITKIIDSFENVTKVAAFC